MTRRERLERKLEKRREWAASRRKKARESFDSARRATEDIPFGQPILVGHHSEKRHRAAIARSESKMQAGVENSSMAEHHEEKASGLESQLERSIFSDDPDAIEQLNERIAEMEEQRKEYKRLNAWWRKHKTMVGCPGLSDEFAKKLDEEIPKRYSWQRQPFPSYTLQNLGSNIRRLQNRVKEIESRQSRTKAAEENGGVVIEGGEWVRVTFSEKPDRDILTALKSAGFHWNRGSWVGRRENLPDCLAPTDERG